MDRLRPRDLDLDPMTLIYELLEIPKKNQQFCRFIYFLKLTSQI